MNRRRQNGPEKDKYEPGSSSRLWWVTGLDSGMVSCVGIYMCAYKLEQVYHGRASVVVSVWAITHTIPGFTYFL